MFVFAQILALIAIITWVISILLKKKKMFYDKFWGFQFVSTIKNYDL